MDLQWENCRESIPTSSVYIDKLERPRCDVSGMMIRARYPPSGTLFMIDPYSSKKMDAKVEDLERGRFPWKHFSVSFGLLKRIYPQAKKSGDFPCNFSMLFKSWCCSSQVKSIDVPDFVLLVDE